MPLKVKRLETLIDVLENTRPKKFSLDRWMDVYSQFDENDRVFKPSKVEDETVFDGMIVDKSVEYMTDKDHDEFPLYTAKPMECQTAGCAMGWAAADKRFNRLGLSLAVDAEIYTKKSENRAALTWPYTPHTYLALIDKKTKKAVTDEEVIAEKLFGIKEATWRYLFYKDRYRVENPTPKMVAKRVRLLIKLGETEFLKKLGHHTY